MDRNSPLVEIANSVRTPALDPDAFDGDRSGRRPLLAVLRANPRLLVAAVLLLLLVLSAVLAPVLSPHDPTLAEPDNALLAPSLAHPFGTDELGRDMFSRVIWGGRVSLPVGLVAVVIGLLIGGGIGLLAGYRGRLTDLLLMRVVDAILAFPGLILAIGINAALGPGLRNAMIAIGVVAIPVYARLVRAQVLQLKTLDFVSAARALGASPVRILARHLVPNLLNPILVQVSLSAGFAILAEATLAFLGLGASPPTPDWGFMIETGSRYLINGLWWMAVAPGIAISVAVFGFNLLGDALRDVLDPRLRG